MVTFRHNEPEIVRVPKLNNVNARVGSLEAQTHQPLDPQLTSVASLDWSGSAGKVMRVNAGETAFELATPSGGGGSAAWTLIETRTVSAVATADFAGLAAYNEVRIVARLLTATITGRRRLLVSVDNGSTFFTATTDYKYITSGGAETDIAGILHSTNATTARTLVATIQTKGPVKSIGASAADVSEWLFVGSTSDINAIRVDNSGGGTISGTIHVFGR